MKHSNQRIRRWLISGAADSHAAAAATWNEREGSREITVTIVAKDTLKYI